MKLIKLLSIIYKEAIYQNTFFKITSLNRSRKLGGLKFKSSLKDIKNDLRNATT